MKYLALILLAVLIGGCSAATAYQKSGLTGGYSSKELEPGIFRVVFGGNGFTSRETVQTYWLYRCTEVALENGYDGFEILSNITLTMNFSPDEFFSSGSPIRPAQMVFIPMETGPKPLLEADIRMLKAPIEEAPPKVFDARKLQEALRPYVHPEKKCSSGNVCEHVHKYLHPDGTFDNST